MNKTELIKSAIEAREMAYCPYSKFQVGAYGATNCAERTAIFNGVSNGNKVLKALALIGDTNNFTYPCGICRQVICEFAENKDIKIYIIKNENEVIETTLEDIMPGAFTKKDLEI